MPDRSDWWANRIGAVASATSSRYSPQPDLALAAELGQAGLTPTEFEDTVNHMMTMADEQDQAAVQIQAAQLLAQGDEAGALALLQESQEDEEEDNRPWWKKAGSAVGGALTGGMDWLVERGRDLDRVVLGAWLGKDNVDRAHEATDEAAEDVGAAYDGIYRALSAATIATGTLADENGYSLTERFSPENWREAWRMADNVTLGQAIVDPVALGPGRTLEAYRKGFDPETHKPRDKAYAELRDQSLFYNAASGSLDFAKAWYFDPLVVGGKAAQVGRAHIRGDLTNMGPNAERKVRTIVAASDDELAQLVHVPRWDLVGQNALRLRERMLALRDEVRQGKRDVVSLVENDLAFRGSPDAAALFHQASRAKRLDPETGRLTDEFDDDLFRDFVGASFGHGGAVQRLANRGADGSDLATAIEQMRETRIPALDELANASAQRFDDLRADESLTGFQRYERSMNAEVDFTQQMQKADHANEMLSRYESHLDFVTNAATRSYDQLRAVPGGGRSTFDVATTVYRPNGSSSIAQTYTKPSIAALRKRPGVIDLHRPGSLYENGNRYFESMKAYGDKGVKQFENFEGVRRDWLNRAANATTDQERRILAGRMEDIGTEVVAAKHGLDADVAREVLSHVRGRRESLFAEIQNRHQETGAIQQGGGNYIGSFSFAEEGVNHTIDLPLSTTQLQNSFFATDLRAMDAFLGQHGRAISNSLSDVLRSKYVDRPAEKITSVLEAYNSFWKPSVLFRLGYPLRTVTDDMARAFAMSDQALRLLARAPEAAAIGAANVVPRTINMARLPFRARAQQRWEQRNADVLKTADPADAALAAPDPARVHAIEQATLGADDWSYADAHARANGRKAPAGRKPALVGKFERLLDGGEDFAFDVASGRKLKANQEVHDFGLSRAAEFSHKPTAVELAHYAGRNADRLSHVDGVLTVSKQGEGWRVSVGRKGANNRKLRTLQQRAMSRGVAVGAYEFGAPGAPGEGDMFIPLASSESTWRALAKSHESNVAQWRAKALEEGRSTTPRDGRRHAENWAQAVNRYILKDPVARRVLEIGPDDTVRWLRNDGEGRQVARRMPHKGANPTQWTDQLSQQLEVLLPDEALRAKVMRGEELNPDELLARMQTHPEQVPAAVDGASLGLTTGHGWFADRQRGFIDGVYNVLATIPTDTLVRHPFFRDQYQSRLRGMVDTLDETLLNIDGTIPPNQLKLMERQSREFALKQTRRYMFSLADTTELTHSMRFLSPFMGAWQETMTRWLTIAAERPQQIARIWGQGWQNIEDIWFLDMVDEEGRSSDDPEHGELTNIRMPVPKWFNENVLAKFMPDEAAELIHSVNLNKEGMNAILQGSPWWLPSGGPVMQFPAKAVLGSQPHLADENAFTSFMYKYLFPTGVPENVDALLPAGWQQQALRFARGTDDPVFATLAANVHKLDVHRWEAEGRLTPRPTESEAVNKASAIQAMMIAGRFVSPTSFQFEVGDPDSAVPAQFFIDAARRVQAEEGDWNKALQRFTEQYGDDAYVWWTATSKNKTGVPPTSAAFKGQQTWGDLISDYPEVGLAIVGLDTQNGPFNYEVYRSQQQAGDRTRLAPAEAQARAESEKGWSEWSRFSLAVDSELASRGLTNIQQSAAADIQQLQRNYEAQLRRAYPGWAADKDQITLGGRGYQIVDAFRSVIEQGNGPDPRFRQDWRGVAEYVSLHQMFGQELDMRYMNGGSRDITTQQNADLNMLWNTALGQIVQSNPMFADLYHRMLEHHELTRGSN